MSTHNPDSLTDEQVETSEGWRLLDEDEVIPTANKQCAICSWISSYAQWTDPVEYGFQKKATYRTKLSRAELDAARGLSKQPTGNEVNPCEPSTQPLTRSDAAQTSNPDAAATPTCSSCGGSSNPMRRNSRNAVACADCFRSWRYVQDIEDWKIITATPRRDACLAEINALNTSDLNRAYTGCSKLSKLVAVLERELSAETARREEAERQFEIANNSYGVAHTQGCSIAAELILCERDRDDLRASLATSEAQRANLETMSQSLNEECASLRQQLDNDDDEECKLCKQIAQERDEAVAQRAQAEAREKVLEQNLGDARKRLHEQMSLTWTAESKSAQAEAKVRNLSESLENSKQARVGHIESLKERDEGIKQLRSALTTERRAREQAEADAIGLRKSLKEMLGWFGHPRREEWSSEGAFNAAKEVEDRANAALSTNSGKALLARIDAQTVLLTKLRSDYDHAWPHSTDEDNKYREIVLAEIEKVLTP